MTLQFAILTLLGSALFVAANGLAPTSTWLPWTLTGAWRAFWTAVVTALTTGCNVALASDQPPQAVGIALVTASPTWMLLLAQALSEWVRWRRSLRLPVSEPLNIPEPPPTLKSPMFPPPSEPPNASPR